MKILKEGRKPGVWYREVECHHCNSSLLLEENDLRIEENYSLGEMDESLYYHCGFCKRKITMWYYNDIPEKVVEEAKRKYKERF